MWFDTAPWTSIWRVGWVEQNWETRCRTFKHTWHAIPRRIPWRTQWNPTSYHQMLEISQTYRWVSLHISEIGVVWKRRDFSLDRWRFGITRSSPLALTVRQYARSAAIPCNLVQFSFWFFVWKVATGRSLLQRSVAIRHSLLSENKMTLFSLTWISGKFVQCL